MAGLIRQTPGFRDFEQKFCLHELAMGEVYENIKAEAKLGDFFSVLQFIDVVLGATADPHGSQTQLRTETGAETFIGPSHQGFHGEIPPNFMKF